MTSTTTTAKIQLIACLAHEKKKKNNICNNISMYYNPCRYILLSGHVSLQGKFSVIQVFIFSFISI